jgi:uncharacterized protein involved in type VI secretion and phage assembly
MTSTAFRRYAGKYSRKSNRSRTRLMANTQKYLGKYRAVVVNTNDPLRLGRIQAIVPDLSNDKPSSWAMPCVPLAGPHMGLYGLPPVGAQVWIEFEAGDPDRPIWVGGFWQSAGELPAVAGAAAPTAGPIILQTAQKNSMTLSDQAGPGGGIVLTSASGASIAVSDAGIFISNGKGASIALVGPSVIVNNGALEIV